MYWLLAVFLSIFPITATAIPLSDEELFNQGRVAYQNKNYVEAAMALYAYVQRDSVALREDPQHREQVERALEFAREHPAQQLGRVGGELTRCRKNISELAERCDEPGPVASTSSYILKPPPPLDNSPAEQPQPKGYTIVCRGGGSLRLNWQPKAQEVGLESALILRFEKGTRGVGEQPKRLGAGQCSWRDRGLRESEPASLCFELRPEQFTISWSLREGRIRNIGGKVPGTLTRLSDSKEITQFHVYNNRRGCLVVKSLLPDVNHDLFKQFERQQRLPFRP